LDELCLLVTERALSWLPSTVGALIEILRAGLELIAIIEVAVITRVHWLGDVQKKRWLKTGDQQVKLLELTLGITPAKSPAISNRLATRRGGQVWPDRTDRSGR
jgi:hypothetical protein